jgi:hypothetical protein
MMLAAVLMLLVPQQGESVVGQGLRYLARHQVQDCWGRRPGWCTCPAEPARPEPPDDDAVQARVGALIADLDDDDFLRRDQALRNLVAIGSRAVPRLREFTEKGTPEVQWRARAALRDIGAAGTSEDLEATAMALMAFLGAGYSHLSKDVYDDIPFGTVVKRGVQWLIDRQAEDGSFKGAGIVAHAWAALVLSEAFGLTASRPLQEPAQRAIDWLVDHPANDARGLFYQGMALKSAELSELTFPRAAAERTTNTLAAKRADEPASIFIRASTQVLQIFTFKSKRLLDLRGLPGVDASRMEMETAYVVMLALFQAEGPGGPVWKSFSEHEKVRNLDAQNRVPETCERGSWSAVGTRERLKACSLATLSREVYCR